MDPVTGLILAIILADVITAGRVHTAFLGATTGAARETGREVRRHIPDRVLTHPATRGAAGTAKVIGIGARSVYRGVRWGSTPGAREALRERDARAARRGRPAARWVWQTDPALRVIGRVQVRRRPPAGGTPAPTPGVTPAGGGVRGRTPRLATTPGGGTPIRHLRPVPTPTPTPTPAPEGEALEATGTDGTPTPTPAPTGPAGATPAPAPTPTPERTPGSPGQEEDTVPVDTIHTPNTVTEDVPTHIRAGLDLATAVEDVAEQFQTALADRVRQHIHSAEAITGFPPSLMGEWEDTVASPIEQAFTLLRTAAEGARGIAAREERELAPLVEAAETAPADASALTVGALTPR